MSLDGDAPDDSLEVGESMRPGTLPDWLGSLLWELPVDDWVLSADDSWDWPVSLEDDGIPGESNSSDDEGGASIPSECDGSADSLDEEDDVEVWLFDDEDDEDEDEEGD